jgi:hypothetical protein
VRLSRRLAPPPRPARPSRVGAVAADVTGLDPAGAVVHRHLASPTGREPTAPAGRTLLVFLTSSCVACQGFWEGFADGGAARLPDAPETIIVTPGAALESRRRVAELAPPGVPVLMSADAWSDYRVTGSPFAVAIGDGSVIAEGPVLGWDELARLIG